MKLATVSSVDLKSCIIFGTPGAIIEDDNGVRKVTEEMTAMLLMIFLVGQLMAFSGSSGPSQSTILGSLGPADVGRSSASMVVSTSGRPGSTSLSGRSSFS